MPILDILLERASSTGDIVIVTSTVSIVEVAFAKAERSGGVLDPSIQSAIDSLWSDRSVLRLVEFNQTLARAARGLLRRSAATRRHLKPMDAIHLASAMNRQVFECQTTDARLQRWNDLGFPVRSPMIDVL